MTVSAAFPSGTYAYFLTDDYPVVPRCFAGTPDPSFRFGPR
ncbi:YHYH protein [Ruegeria arenilitoris]